jgi:hypothetical protein
MWPVFGLKLSMEVVKWLILLTMIVFPARHAKRNARYHALKRVTANLLSTHQNVHHAALAPTPAR